MYGVEELVRRSNGDLRALMMDMQLYAGLSLLLYNSSLLLRVCVCVCVRARVYAAVEGRSVCADDEYAALCWSLCCMIGLFCCILGDYRSL